MLARCYGSTFSNVSSLLMSDLYKEFGIDVYWINDAGKIYHKHTSEVVEPYDLRPLPPKGPK